MSFASEMGHYIDPLDQRFGSALNHVTSGVTVILSTFNLTEADGSTNLTLADGTTPLTGVRATAP